MKAKEEQPILDERETKAGRPLKVLYPPKGRYCDRKCLVSKTGRGKPAQGRSGIVPWKWNE